MIKLSSLYCIVLYCIVLYYFVSGHTTWGGRTRKLLKKTKIMVESGEMTHKKYIQLRILHYRGAEYAPDNECEEAVTAASCCYPVRVLY
jgi:hypothetical protein